MGCSLISQARLLEWVAISFSRGSSWHRDQTHIFCIGRRVLHHWATLEAIVNIKESPKEWYLLCEKWSSGTGRISSELSIQLDSGPPALFGGSQSGRKWQGILLAAMLHQVTLFVVEMVLSRIKQSSGSWYSGQMPDDLSELICFST